MRALTDAPRCPVVPTDPQTDHVTGIDDQTAEGATRWFLATCSAMAGVWSSGTKCLTGTVWTRSTLVALGGLVTPVRPGAEWDPRLTKRCPLTASAARATPRRSTTFGPRTCSPASHQEAGC
jgi:hypothetical protein